LMKGLNRLVKDGEKASGTEQRVSLNKKRLSDKDRPSIAKKIVSQNQVQLLLAFCEVKYRRGPI